MNYDKQETFEIVSPVNMQNSYGVLDSEDNAKLSITVAVDTKRGRGYFEIYDLESGGERFYGEGGLWFEGNELTDYDGVFELPQQVGDKLKEWGFDTSYID